MPLITLTTNVKLGSEDATKAFVLKFSKFCAQTLEKPESAFSINVIYNPYLTFAGTFDPAIMLQIMSLYNTNAENSKVWSKALSEFFQEQLGVPSDRGYMAFLDPGPAFIGSRGSTIEALRAAAKP
ncbi:Tautomerase/MIF superfamily [Hygrophoropsis aurantiaca]|uniref:Tautomerase/MIF superfamily n=1 Tax=Hygrophoropsis aurantiaca TaxID=72124 RepID=A0ACB8AL09_9AGAM|nr:Tautomerase/MIF superfamily [Hygrophoropsis aurantiaca]